MSPQDSKSASRGVHVQKPGSNVYTVMLLVALVALVIGCVLLYLEIDSYGGFSSLHRPGGGTFGGAAAPVYAHVAPDMVSATV